MDEIPLSTINNINNEVDRFNQLSMDLENESIRFNEDHNLNGNADVELGEAGFNEEDFKLIKYFENSQRQLLENGHKTKKMGVSINNLTVVGQGAESSVIMDNFTPIRKLFSLLNPLNWKKKNKPTFNILNNINGFVEDGKMLLVLGRPGAGCSTLLRVISNQRESYIDIKGDIKYGNISASKWKRFKGEAIYTPEEDIHHPTLTLHETLDFALKLKTPGNRLPEETKRIFRTKIYDLLASMYGLVNQRDTMVGNEYIRGLSGGERKRCTIAEAMVSSSSINCWDCSTRGLDAASAFDYAKSLRIMSDTLGKTTIASFYQASDNIYSLFDKVMILDKGRCIYFGPTKLAKQYFLDLGFECEERKSIPDFLTGITNPQERIINQSFKGQIPETSADFEDSWKSSELFKESINSQKEYEEKVEIEQPSKDFIEQVLNEKSKTSSKRSPFAASFFTQVISLASRQFKLLWGDKFTLTSNIGTIIILSFVYGSVYFNLDKSIDGLFTRSGAIFNSIFMMSIISEAELHGTYYGRRVLQKQKSYALYRPSAYYLSQVIVDIPYSLLQGFLHSIICYWMYNLDRDAAKFFIFAFTLSGVSLASCSLHRAIGNLTPSMFVGQNVLNIMFMFMINYMGYSTPYDKQYPWFKWFTWCFSLSYAFKGLMENEFINSEFSCSSAAIPYGVEDQYRICPVAGSTQGGNLTVSGATYLEKTYQLDVNDRAFNIGMVFVFWIFYIVLNLIALEVLDWTGGGYTRKVYKKGKAPKINDVEEEKNINKITKEATEHMKQSLKLNGGIFTWNNIKYTVPVKEGPKLLLDDVMGWIRPGQMTALMGSSGAGKTTLLDVLAKRKTIGTVEGESYLNGRPLQIDFERITGYVEQMDVHNPGLTVREALRFSARLRQEPSVSLEEKYEYVERVLEMMEMKHLGDALVGSLENGIGISVEERKRLTIGLELVAKPHILFLDEPTSGLDAQSSYNIVKFIRKLADAGMPLVCTIHQPSSVLFEQFDRLLLLARGGKTVYFGDIGENSKTLTDYFEKNGGRPSTSSENPAEYILEVIGAGVHGKSEINWSEVWNNSEEHKHVKDELKQINLESKVTLTGNEEEPREFATSFKTQLIEVYCRLNKIWFRDPFYTIGGWLQMAVCGLVVGFTFYNIKDSSSDMNSRIFMAWMNLVLGVLLIYLTLPQFFIQKEYFKRDFASKYYSWGPFALSIMAVEIPYVIVSATLFFVTTYWTAGLQSSGINDFYYWLMLVVFSIYTVSFGQALGAACVDLYLSLSVLPIVLIYLFLFTGVQISEKDLPTFYSSWLYPLNPTKYFVEGIVTTVLNDVKVKCTEEDLIKFSSPPNQTCDGFTSEFQKESMGYITTLNNDPTSCGFCQYGKGSDYFESALNFHFEDRWRNLGILIAYIGSNIILIVSFVYLTRKSKR